MEGWKDRRTEDRKGKRNLEIRAYHRESVWERYVVEVEGWKREKDFVLIIERRVWRKGGRIEKAKRILSRLVERGYLKKHKVWLRWKDGKGISAKGYGLFISLSL